MATDPTQERPLFSIAALPDPCEDAGSLLTKAERCRRLAAGVSDRKAADVLTRMAANYQQAAEHVAAKD